MKKIIKEAACPECGETYSVGRIQGKNYYCHDCCIEFNKKGTILYSYTGKVSVDGRKYNAS